jgi:hypothetical protein
MGNGRISWSLSLLVLLFAGRVGAVGLEVVSSDNSVLLGGLVDVSVVVSDLGNSAPPSVGAFDLELQFDNTLVSFNSASVGGGLGDIGLGEAVTGTVANATDVDVFEVSLLTPAELNALQTDSFTLFTVTFKGIAPGTAAFNVVLNAPLSDELGDPIDTPTLTNLALEVTEPKPVPAVTEPIPVPALTPWAAALLLLSLLLAGLLRLGRKGR